MNKMTDEEFNDHLMEIFPQEAFQGDLFNYHPSYLIEGLLELSLKAQEIEEECEDPFLSLDCIIKNARCIQACINFIGFILDKDQWNQCVMSKID